MTDEWSKTGSRPVYEAAMAATAPRPPRTVKLRANLLLPASLDALEAHAWLLRGEGWYEVEHTYDRTTLELVVTMREGSGGSLAQLAEVGM